MNRSLPAPVRRLLFVAVGSVILAGLTSTAGFAQGRMGGMKERIMDDIANDMVRSIQSDSCADFEAMLKKKKSGSSGSSKASGMMKSDPAARARFVNKVAGPLLNKMIDCDLLPGR